MGEHVVNYEAEHESAHPTAQCGGEVLHPASGQKDTTYKRLYEREQELI